MALDPFEEPKKKPGDSLAQALAVLGGGQGQVSGASGFPLYAFGTGFTPSGVGSLPQSGQGDTGMGGGISSGYAGPTGPLGSSLASAIGLGNLGAKTLGTLGGLFGVGALSPLGLAAAPLGFVSLANKLASMFGAQPSWGFEAPDLQGIRDYFGAYAAEQAAKDFGQKMADWNAQVAQDETGYANYANTTTPAGWGDSPKAPDATVSNPDMDSRSMSGLGPSGGSNTGQGPGGTTSDTAEGGHGTTGDASMNALGGVHFAVRPERAIFGEAGPEAAIFIPEFMRKPGLQGNERQVRSALMRAILSLR